MGLILDKSIFDQSASHQADWLLTLSSPCVVGEWRAVCTQPRAALIQLQQYREPWQMHTSLPNSCPVKLPPANKFIACGECGFHASYDVWTITPTRLADTYFPMDLCKNQHWKGKRKPLINFLRCAGNFNCASPCLSYPCCSRTKIKGANCPRNCKTARSPLCHSNVHLASKCFPSCEAPTRSQCDRRQEIRRYPHDNAKVTITTG